MKKEKKKKSFLAGKYIQLWLWAIMHMISNDRICAQCPRTKEYHDTISSRVPCQSSTAEVFGFLSALWVLEHSQCAWALSMCMAALWVPKRSLWVPGWSQGDQVNCGCPGALLVPGRSVGSWAISACMSAPFGCLGASSGCLGSV